MTEEVRMSAIIQEIEAQRSILASRSAQLAGELAVQLKKLEDQAKELEELKKPKEPKEI